MTRSPDQEDSMEPDDFTPSEDRIRECYHLGYGRVAREVTDAEFDRWMDAHNERVRINALDAAAARLTVIRDIHAEELGDDSPYVTGLTQAVALIRKYA